MFKHICPNCRKPKVIVKRCDECFKLVCSHCGINGLCIDCFTHLKSKEEIEAYFDLKYLENPFMVTGQ